jgi:hypothetical protein
VVAIVLLGIATLIGFLVPPGRRFVDREQEKRTRP